VDSAPSPLFLPGFCSHARVHVYMDQSNGEEDEVLFSLLLLSSPCVCVCERGRGNVRACVRLSALCCDLVSSSSSSSVGRTGGGVGGLELFIGYGLVRAEEESSPFYSSASPAPPSVPDSSPPLHLFLLWAPRSLLVPRNACVCVSLNRIG
jgi:hypothetical protein